MSKSKLRSARPLFLSLATITTELIELITSADSIMINAIPFKDSWTAAQLASHIMKSNRAISQAMEMDGKRAERDPGERIQELKDMFLNYKTRFQSPAFIMPEKDIYGKDILVADLKKSIDDFRIKSSNADLSEIINLPAFGEITKMELAWFVLYHTQRHIHQLKNIIRNLESQ